MEESFEEKRSYIEKYKADILVMGSDWAGKFEELDDICQIKILERTENVSTTEIITKIKN